MFRKIGLNIINIFKSVNFLLALSVTILFLTFKPSSWSKTVIQVLARQILFTGIQALGLLISVAFMVGILIIVQTQLLLIQAGQTELLGKILVIVIIREIAPLFTTLIVIARSGTAIASELANMRYTQEIDLLDSQGIEPMTYLVMPRVLGVSISIFCLTMAFITIALFSGYLSGQLYAEGAMDLEIFTKNILLAIKPTDFYNILSKSLLISYFIGVICSYEGLKVQGIITEVPQAVTKAVEKSIIALFFLSAIISILTYI